MTKLLELLLIKDPKKGTFGIEIECEGENLNANVPIQWNVEDDGSLRGVFPKSRAEYVLKKPLGMVEAVAAVYDLAKCQEKANLNFSFRTSVHVHLNVLDLTPAEYLNLIYTYLLIEEPLIRYCGQERICNRFCLRLQDAEGLMETLVPMFAKFKLKGDYLGDQIRYSAINLSATTKYGSLEFRAMKGNLEVKYIHDWLCALGNLKLYAKSFESPQHIHDEFVRNKPSVFLQNVLKNVYPLFSYEGEEADMRNSFALTIQLPYSYVPFKDPKVGVKPNEPNNDGRMPINYNIGIGQGVNIVDPRLIINDGF